MTTKLSIYNGALSLCGEGALLSALTDDRPPRYFLDGVWDRGGVDTCLRAGQWKFALRSIMVDYDPSVDPAFGYQYAFSQPEDFIRLAAISGNEYFDPPLASYADERHYWHANQETIYVSHVSNHATYGGDLSLWPSDFTRFVEAHFAVEICPQLSNAASRVEKLEKVRDKRLADALSVDAQAGPSKRFPTGSWILARTGGWGSRSRER